MVYWIWASQVSFNVRFRQQDWFQRLVVVLQLLIFCSLAAFTNNFDITFGFGSASSQEQINGLLIQAGNNKAEVLAEAAFAGLTPKLNNKGIL